ncbi:MAG: translation initiation factor IF-3 [Actinobacteria bacterium]|nr:translation initiation factor IF-3 [Actinomycetota bacterium]
MGSITIRWLLAACFFCLSIEGGIDITGKLRINEMIRSPQVRLISSDGSQLGIKSIEEAQSIALGQDLDLVEVAPQASPPVCKIMDYGKYCYELEQKLKAARKKQSVIVVKEMKMRPKIDIHDYETKKRHVKRFLEHGNKVKVTIMFRGREMSHTDLGMNLLTRLAEDLEDVAVMEAKPKLDGRNMTIVLAPCVGEPSKE